MGLNFGDKSLLIRYIQQYIKELYNSNIYITSEYYTHFEMNYGMAHFIAKYLDYKYPVLDKATKDAYSNIKDGQTKNIDTCISVMNYFLSDNKGNRLKFNSVYTYDNDSRRYVPQDSPQGMDYIQYHPYNEIYNDYMIVANVINENGTTTCRPIYQKFVVDNDLPLFVTKNDDETYSIDQNIIFKLQSWSIPKKICELDEFVMSYLLGQTITPDSSMEDIYYAQQLVYQQEIDNVHKGIWCLPGEEGSYYDLTSAIIQYQQQKVNKLSRTPLFVTGYFDIFTEAALLRDLGEREDGITGL